METVLSELRDERDRQNDKWGEQNHDPVTWLAILMEEVGEASQAAVQASLEPGKLTWPDYRAEMVQVAAVAVSMIESYDRNPFHDPVFLGDEVLVGDEKGVLVGCLPDGSSAAVAFTDGSVIWLSTQDVLLVSKGEAE